MVIINLNKLKSSQIKFLNISFNDNIGTIFKTETETATPLNYSGLNILDWSSPNVDGITEYYNDDDNTEYNNIRLNNMHKS